MKRIKATVITDLGERVLLSLICQSRAIADQVIDQLYPDARYSSVIVQRQAGGQPC